MSDAVAQEDLDRVAAQLGRAPRGVLAIAYRTPDGEPAVVKTAPRLPDGTPFPTFYYLTHPGATAAMSALDYPDGPPPPRQRPPSRPSAWSSSVPRACGDDPNADQAREWSF